MVYVIIILESFISGKRKHSLLGLSKWLELYVRSRSPPFQPDWLTTALHTLNANLYPDSFNLEGLSSSALCV